MKIRQVSYTEILGDGSSQDLVAEYAAECQVSEANPQIHMYEALERCGSLGCFGAYIDEELVGFASVLVSVMPHHGKPVGTIESIFVSKVFRHTAAGNALLNAVEEYAEARGCIAVLYTARVGSALATILSRRRWCERSHEIFTRWFHERSPGTDSGS